ncbi:Aminoglycoside phosphotransferase [Niveomyces insectorum RCEF 264]|uniref:Aminoglycoside phosphotransferase n=1 Tax=Niveomyces insectorum RCEF 264 TaxID=1081102 RepID=A0A167P6V4_9HYPO|nr:Aminoglycoside phosphotransferase [Niveomyces insectorum RCEF 264]
MNARPMTGSMNWAIVVAFEDGVEWIFRSPRPQRRNEIGVPYILQSKTAGRRIRDYDFFEVKGVSELTHDQKTKVMRQLRAFSLQLAGLRHPQIGSLFEHATNDGPKSYYIGECLAPALAWDERQLLEELERGPVLPLHYHALFAPVPDKKEYTSVASFQTAMSRWNEFSFVGYKFEQSRNRFEYCLAGQILHDTVVPRLCTAGSSSTDQSNSNENGVDGGGRNDASSFYLKHPDLHGGNIFVDEHVNITGIIDWSYTTTVPLAELWATPRIWTNEPTLAAVFRGVAEEAAAIGGKSAVPPAIELDRFWDKVDKLQHFQQFVRLLSPRDYDHFAALLEQNSDGEGDGDGDGDGSLAADIPDLLARRAQTSANQALLHELAQDDNTPKDIALAERQGFATMQAVDDRLAVARKLTVVRQMNRRFVADKRLWHWLDAALEGAKEEAI